MAPASEIPPRATRQRRRTGPARPATRRSGPARRAVPGDGQRFSARPRRTPSVALEAAGAVDRDRTVSRTTSVSLKRSPISGSVTVSPRAHHQCPAVTLREARAQVHSPERHGSVAPHAASAPKRKRDALCLPESETSRGDAVRRPESGRSSNRLPRIAFHTLAPGHPRLGEDESRCARWRVTFRAADLADLPRSTAARRRQCGPADSTNARIRATEQRLPVRSRFRRPQCISLLLGALAACGATDPCRSGEMHLRTRFSQGYAGHWVVAPAATPSRSPRWATASSSRCRPRYRAGRGRRHLPLQGHAGVRPCRALKRWPSPGTALRSRPDLRVAGRAGPVRRRWRVARGGFARGRHSVRLAARR